MREFKFRVWYEGKMWPCGIGDDDHVTVWKDDCLYCVGVVNGGSSLIVPCQPMQYTGLKDKNGVEIYEGDIIAVPAEEVVPILDDGSGPTEHYNELLVARFVEGSFRFINDENYLVYQSETKISLTKEQIEDEYCDWNEIEVRGNVFEQEEEDGG